MKFLVILPDAYGSKGGIAKFNRDLLESLCSYPNCEQVVALPRVMPEEMGNIPSKLKYITDGLNGKVSYIFCLIKTLLKNNDFDLIIYGHVNLTPLHSLISKFIQAPSILITHGIDVWEPISKKSVVKNLKKINYFISVSDLTRNRFLKWAPFTKQESYILPNSFEPGKFSTGPKNEELMSKHNLKNKKVLMTLGRLFSKERYKGFDEVIEVLPLVTKKYPNVVYMIVGDGPDRNRLENKVKNIGVENCVIFVGEIEENVKADYYRLADLFLMPSRGEGFGIVLLEALASGVPVIASQLDGSREALREGLLGKLVDPRDTYELVETVLEELEAPSKVNTAGLEFFSFSNFQKRFHGILEDINSATKSNIGNH
ncbi:glycosyltransferase involved in cell wall biosynthesis [Bacillus sp. BK006]|nr:glycosyltransferase involved in cell wall biosynthesis [Bacillus sp. BK006]